jgi:hypothetical protein
MGFLRTFLIALLVQPLSVFGGESFEHGSCNLAITSSPGQFIDSNLIDELGPYFKERGYYPYAVANPSNVNKGLVFTFTVRPERTLKTLFIWKSEVVAAQIKTKAKSRTFLHFESKGSDLKDAIKDLPPCVINKGKIDLEE